MFGRSGCLVRGDSESRNVMPRDQYWRGVDGRIDGPAAAWLAFLIDGWNIGALASAGVSLAGAIGETIASARTKGAALSETGRQLVRQRCLDAQFQLLSPLRHFSVVQRLSLFRGEVEIRPGFMRTRPSVFDCTTVGARTLTCSPHWITRRNDFQPIKGQRCAPFGSSPQNEGLPWAPQP
jgi:hypothetical protein